MEILHKQLFWAALRYDAYDSKTFVIGAFLDSSKAFDTIDHDLLSYNLYRYDKNCLQFHEIVSNWQNTIYSDTKPQFHWPQVCYREVTLAFYKTIFTSMIKLFINFVKQLCMQAILYFLAEFESLDLLTLFIG